MKRTLLVMSLAAAASVLPAAPSRAEVKPVVCVAEYDPSGFADTCTSDFSDSQPLVSYRCTPGLVQVCVGVWI